MSSVVVVKHIWMALENCRHWLTVALAVRSYQGTEK